MTTILLIDDCRSVRDVCQNELHLVGYDVLSVRDGASACRLLESISVDLVVLDVRMPGLGGPDTFARLRADHPELPVVFHTSERQPAAIADVLGPTVRFVRKSGGFDELIDAIQGSIGARRELVKSANATEGLAELNGAPGSASLAGDKGAPCLTASLRRAGNWILPRQPR